MRKTLIIGKKGQKYRFFALFDATRLRILTIYRLEPSSGFSLPFLCISRRLDQNWGSLLQTYPHTHTITQIIVRFNTYIFSRVIPLYSHETKPNLCLLISFLNHNHFYNWLYNLDLFCCTFITNIKQQQHCCKVENGITAIRSGPDFTAKNPVWTSVTDRQKISV